MKKLEKNKIVKWDFVACGQFKEVDNSIYSLSSEKWYERTNY